MKMARKSNAAGQVIVAMDIIFYVHGLKLCNECFNEDLVYDERRDETYCSRCGLILKDHSFKAAWDDACNERETVENFRQLLYTKYDKEVVDSMISDIFNQQLL